MANQYQGQITGFGPQDDSMRIHCLLRKADLHNHKAMIVITPFRRSKKEWTIVKIKSEKDFLHINCQQEKLIGHRKASISFIYSNPQDQDNFLKQHLVIGGKVKIDLPTALEKKAKFKVTFG